MGITDTRIRRALSGKEGFPGNICLSARSRTAISTCPLNAPPLFHQPDELLLLRRESANRDAEFYFK